MTQARLSGEQAWLDLTVENATQVKDFYQSVIGWKSQAVSMGDYDDFVMIPFEAESDDAQPAAGICHAKGSNSDIPPMWIPYFLVANIDQSVAATTENGGEVIGGIRSFGKDRFAIIRDPAGACCAIYQDA